MIATALTFVSGFLTAALIALVVAPLFWSRSRRLALREYRASIPASAREIRASLDHVRAEVALAARRREIKAEAQSEKAALARADAGRVANENADLRAHNTILMESLGSVTADFEEATQQLELRDAEIEEVDGALRTVQDELDLRTDELESLAARFQNLAEIAEERRASIAELEARIEELSDSQREAGRDRRESNQAIDRLRSEVNALKEQLGKEKNTVKRLDDKSTRLASQLAERDDRIYRAPGDTAGAAMVGAARRDVRHGAESADLDAQEDARRESRLRVRPAVRPAFGRKGDETDAEPPIAEEDPVPSSKMAIAEPAPVVPASGIESGTTESDEPKADMSAGSATGKAGKTVGTGSSLAESLGLSARPEFPDDLGDGELRETLGDLAARVIALTAEKEGPRSPLDAILDTETVQSASAGRDGGSLSLADRVRRLRDEARDQAAE